MEFTLDYVLALAIITITSFLIGCVSMVVFGRIFKVK
jgi:hypothetical protein